MKINTGVTNPAVKKKKSSDADSNGGDGTFTRFLPRKKPTSPSAWALSPGRAQPILTAVVPPKTPSTGGRSSGEGGGGGGGGGRISGVLKYFKQKKVASSEEADRHCSKLMNNRLLQWRFANARAQAAMSTVKSVAEVFNFMNKKDQRYMIKYQFRDLMFVVVFLCRRKRSMHGLRYLR